MKQYRVDLVRTIVKCHLDVDGVSMAAIDIESKLTIEVQAESLACAAYTVAGMLPTWCVVDVQLTEGSK